MVTSKKLSGTAALIFFIYCTIALSQNARTPKVRARTAVCV